MVKVVEIKTKAKRARKGQQKGQGTALVVIPNGAKRKRNRARKGGQVVVRNQSQSAVQNARRGGNGLRKAGMLAGSYFGPAGMAAGGAIGGIFDSISGMGQYSVKSNTLMSGRPPLFGKGAGEFQFAHSEYLQDVSGSTAFTLQSFLINPGLFATFPFLSSIANNFEQYQMLGLVFEFRSTSADALNSTNTALGTVLMSTEYDTLDANFGSKQQMEAYMFTTQCKPADSMVHPVECNPRMNALANLFIRPGAVPATGDQRFYDVGNFQIATQGMQAAAVIGELWVSYHVKLIKPKLETPLGAGIQAAHYALVPTSTSAFAGSSQRAGSNLTLTFGTTSVTLPYVGRYLVFYTANAATSYTSAGGLTASTNVTFPLVLYNNVAGSQFAGSGSTLVMAIAIADVSAPGGIITMAAPTIVGAATGDIYVVQIPTGLAISDAAKLMRLETLERLVNQMKIDTEDGMDGVELNIFRKEHGILPTIRNDSLSDDDWKCGGEIEEVGAKNSSSSSSIKKPSLERTLSVVNATTSLSDSVVDLITAKLRK